MSDEQEDVGASPRSEASEQSGSMLKVALECWCNNRRTERRLNCQVKDEPWILEVIVHHAESLLLSPPAAKPGWRVSWDNNVWTTHDKLARDVKTATLARLGVAYRVDAI